MAGLSAKHQAFVSAYVGPARYNATQAARIAGYAHPNKQGPALLVNVGIKQEIADHLAQIRSQGIALLEHRVQVLDDLEQRYLTVIEERAEEMAGDAPGAGTGVIVRQIKQVGAGPSAQIIEEYVADTGVSHEIRALHKQAAQELGQWNDDAPSEGLTVRVEIVGVPSEAL